jgi:peptidoglycan L-alanyl-D-glutamate endopeptidase CwlK
VAKFSNTSKRRLAGCHPILRRLCHDAIAVRNFSVVSGYRSSEEQDALFEDGLTTLRGGQSKHNAVDEEGEPCSLAVDLAPWYPGERIPWDDRQRFVAFGSWFVGFAAAQGVELRWGGDWDGDWIFTDQKFHDLPHFELVEVPT